MKPVVLCILDGWGEAPPSPHNAISLARTPHWDTLRSSYPFGTLDASEHHVGLPAGQMGNSEVGHMHLGAGRVVMQDLPRIDAAIADGLLAQNTELHAFITKLRLSGGSAHLMGLCSDGGVHAHVNHLAALANILFHAGIPTLLHLFLDGRDTPPQSARSYVQQLQANLPGAVRIATVCGRYYAMDRDKRWERVSKAYHALVCGEGEQAESAEAAIAASYAAHISDEFLLPTVLSGYRGMKDGDGVLMANFRADRARQLLHALGDADFTGFARARVVAFAAKLGMVEYSSELSPSYAAMFPPESLANDVGAWLAQHGKTQLRLAETEKYAHVTFFFSCGREETLPGETRLLIPSPNVATYDLQPEMSAHELTYALVEAITTQAYDAIIVNYANPDMVGHTGNLQAAIAAVETIDACLGRVVAALEQVGGAMLITADHGNIEMMHDHTTAQAHTAHTLNTVPLLLVHPQFKGKPLPLGQGRLTDMAPTLCALLGLAPPAEMTGTSRVPHA
jgi:2,3-bisphosphoglycerate-independent phosphoglycerate mutase